MGIPERARIGLSISLDSEKREREFDYFLGLKSFFKDIRRQVDPADARRSIVEGLYPYCNLLPPDQRSMDVEREYERYERCIARAQRSYKAFTHDILVSDIEQRVRMHQFVDGVTDPSELIDIALSHQKSGDTVRFEARRALHLGALFFEHETFFGTQLELENILNEINLFFHAFLSIDPRKVNTRMYHKSKTLEDQTEWFQATDIRVPLFEKEKGRPENKREKDENALYVSFNAMNLGAPQGDSPLAHAIVESRVKDPWSAALKAIRKDISIQSLRDCLGYTVYLYPHRGDVLNMVVDALQEALVLDRTDRQIHHTRRGPGAPWESGIEENEFSSSRFHMEKMIALWRPQLLLLHRDAIDGILPFTSSSRRENFWGSLASRAPRTISMEVQLGLIEDFINNRHVPSEENHAIYKAAQLTGGRRRGRAPQERNVLEILCPSQLYGINFNDPSILSALINMQKNRFGIYQEEPEK